MSSKTMADYLSFLIADYVQTLAISPHKVMPETGDKHQSVHEFDDGTVGVVGISDQSYFEVRLQWVKGLSDEDHETILDWWHDSNKANGRARTFYWTHPLDGNDYTVRFMGPLTRSFRPGHMEINQITLRIEGNKPVA